MNKEFVFQPETFFGQIAYVCGGLFLMLIGLAILYTIVDWWMRGQRFEAVVLGVRRLGLQYVTVLQYSLPDGQLRQATLVPAGTSPAGRDTGRRIKIRVMANQPDEARGAPGTAMWLLALAFSLGGAWLTYVAISTWKHGLVVWFLMALIAFFVGRSVWHRLTAMLKHYEPPVDDAWKSLPIENAERFAGAPQPNRIQMSGSNPRRAGLIFCLAGAVVLATDAIPIHHLLQLKHGTRTEGTVFRLHSNNTDRNYGIYPEVQYTNTEGTDVRFMDHTGSNPSPYKVGDRVTVLYVPQRPDTALVDRGLRNWEPVGALVLLGTVLLSLGIFASTRH